MILKKLTSQWTISTLLSNGLPIYNKEAQSKKRILIVEDELFWQLVFEKSLKKIDDQLELLFAASADEALKLILENDPFDLIIADQNLRGIKTGLDLWDHLVELQSPDSQALPVVPYILMSGTEKSEFFEKLMPYREQAVPRYIEKPASVNQLSQQLKEVITDCLPD